MVERLNGIEKVRGSTPLISTNRKAAFAAFLLFPAHIDGDGRVLV